MVLTLTLSLLSLRLIVVVSVPLGVWSSRHAGGPRDGIRTAFNQFCMAVPPFFTGILLTWVFSTVLHGVHPRQFPGLDADLWGSLRYLIFPAVSLAIPRIAMTVRMLRSTIQEEMGKAYVRTAISRGNDRRGVLYHHVLKNALVPVVTFLAQTMAEIVAGSIVWSRCSPCRAWGGCWWLHFQPGLSGGPGHRGDSGFLGGAGRHCRGPHQPAD